MKNLYYSTVLFGIFLLNASVSIAQTSVITTVAGTGAMAYTGDGGPATAATLNQPARIAVDAAGNKYISDAANNCIRKINTAGVITTYAGNGAYGFAGDGGPATAAQLKNPIGLAVDGAGNLYIADQNNYRIRKVSASGVISTVAGNGGSVYSGDGGQATAAGICQVGGVAVDGSGNMYIAASGNRVRKVNTSGIISTIAGTGAAGFSGDGGPATIAMLNLPWDVITDASNNIYICEFYNNRVRKIDPSGIITTLAGNGATSYTGDGGPATAAGLNSPQGIVFDAFGNLYIGDRFNNAVRMIAPSGIIATIAGTGTGGFSGDGGPAITAMISGPTGLTIDQNGDLYIVDAGNDRVRKLNLASSYMADSFYINLMKDCSGLTFNLGTKHFASGMSVNTWFGDGSSNTSPITASFTGSTGYALFSHAYSYNGTYTVKHVLMSGTVPVDSISYTNAYKLCNSIAVNFYLDANSDCKYEPATDPHVYLPITVEIDSNGHPVDTMTTPGGVYYKAYGSPGDVYTIKIIGEPPGLVLTCPATGIVYDTILSSTDSSISINDIGFNCSTVTGFDLGVHAGAWAGRHTFVADIIVDNLYCTPQPATLTAILSPKYAQYSISYAPATTAGNVLSWNFTGLSSGASAPTYIHYHGEHPGTFYIQGDTVNSSYAISPTTGDMNISDNDDVRLDTVNASLDPNHISVTPAGCIPSAVTELEYAVGFENTGKDTAYNIFIMDTLSASLDPSTLEVVAASANVNLMKIKNGGQTVLKFDFPNIMLPDSSHHSSCDGVLMFRIKTRAGSADGTQINNRAGIYFDTNPVVLTNTANNTVNCPPDKTGVSSLTKTSGISIYPNPANDEVTIKTQKDAYNAYTITNQVGQVLIQNSLSTAQTTVDLKTLSGLYYITLKGENGVKVQKFVKM